MEVKVVHFHLEQFPLFEGLPKSLIDRIAAVTTLKTRPSNSTVYDAGDPSDMVFLLNEGLIKVGNFSHDGREVLKMVIRPGELFGELGLAGEEVRNDFATASRSQCSYYAIRVADLKLFMSESPELSNRILLKLGDRIRSTEQRVEDFIFFDSRSRIIDFILDHAQRFGTNSPRGVMFHHYLTHQDIANITGTSRQFVTGVLNSLRRAGYIGFNRLTITVKDSKGLESQTSSRVARHV